MAKRFRFKFIIINHDRMKTALLIISILLLSCSSKHNNTINCDYDELVEFIPDGFIEVGAANSINLGLFDNGTPKGIHYLVEDEKLVDIEAYINGKVCQVVNLDKRGKIKNISKDINEIEKVSQVININELGNVFYIADDCCQDDSVKNGIVYHVDDSLRLNKLIKYEKGHVTNVTNMDGHGTLTDAIFEYGNVDTMLINPSNNSEMYFTKEVRKAVFHPTGWSKKQLIGYTTDEAGIENAYFPPQEVEFYCDDGFYAYDYYYKHDSPFRNILKAILPTKLERNAKKMNNSQRNDYVVKMLASADSAFLKTDDFVIFLNYLQGKCTNEYSESIGNYLMNIYLNYSDKINRLEEYIAMMPSESQRNINKALCRILLYEYAIENRFNNTIKTERLYKEIPILNKYHTLTEEIAKESNIILCR